MKLEFDSKSIGRVRAGDIVRGAMMAHVDYQRLHDTMQELVLAADHVFEVLAGDFPQVRVRIAEYVAQREYSHDPVAALFDAKVAAAKLLREMERLP